MTPKPTKKSRKLHVSMTAARKKRVLELLRDGDFVTNIADAVGVRRQTLYLAKQNDEDFAKAWDEAQAIGHQVQLAATEEEMDFRGRIGWLEPKFYEGKICGHIKRYSDALLMARAKKLDPNGYGDKAKLEHSGQIKGGAVVVPGVITPESWAKVAEQMKELGPPPMPDDDG